jgi:hypothetical protein
MNFSFLYEFKLDEAIIKERGMKEVCRLKHNFFPLTKYDVKEALNTFNPFPGELIQFYREIGFGFFHINRGRIHRILDPQSLIFINLQKDEYKRDKILIESIRENQLVFFDSQAYGYFSLEMNNAQKDNAIYWKGEKIEDSLHHFLYNFHNDKNYLKYMKSDAEEMAKKRKNTGKSNGNKPENKQSDVNTHTPMNKAPDNCPSKSPWLLEDDDSFVIS